MAGDPRIESEVAVTPFVPGDLYALACLATRTSADTYDYILPAGSALENMAIGERAHEFAQAVHVDEVLVARLDDNLVGYTQFGESTIQAPESLLRPDSKELHKLYVATELQRRGIGRKLMDTALARPVLEAAPQVFLWVWGGNTEAIDFYRRYDFAEAAARYYRLGNGERTRDLMMVRDQDQSQS